MCQSMQSKTLSLKTIKNGFSKERSYYSMKNLKRKRFIVARYQTNRKYT